MTTDTAKEFQILLFYAYVFIADPEAVSLWQAELCKKYNLKGRLIVAREGLNVTLEGKTTDTEHYIAELTADSRFNAIHFKRSIGTGNAFRKLSIKVRPEIVSGHLGVCDINPGETTGKRLAAEVLHDWIINNVEIYIIDMRNAYEHTVGKFAGSICPPLENFRDLPKIISSISHLKNKRVVTVCTGGVRCEKASGYLISQGFTDVWQLDGGIVTYMEKYPNEHFEGKLYVFDRRVVMGFYTDDSAHKIIGVCRGCGSASEHFVNCEKPWCGMHFILCEQCVAAQKEEGKVCCVDGCTCRRPNKIKLSFWRLLTRLGIKN